MVRLSVVFVLLAGPVVAAETPPAIPPAMQDSLAAFAAAHETCREWGDGCVLCRRTEGAAFRCSTPGIACEPRALACHDPVNAQ